MELYQENQILPLIRKAQSVKDDPFLLRPDHEIRLAIYDIEIASENLDPNERYIFEKIWDQASINEIANCMKTTERTIYRKMESMISNLYKMLNDKSW